MQCSLNFLQKEGIFMLIAAVDICNTIADVLTEIQNIIGPWPFNEYHHPMLTDDFFYRHAEIFLTRQSQGSKELKVAIAIEDAHFEIDKQRSRRHSSSQGTNYNKK